MKGFKIIDTHICRGIQTLEHQNTRVLRHLNTELTEYPSVPIMFVPYYFAFASFSSIFCEWIPIRVNIPTIIPTAIINKIVYNIFFHLYFLLNFTLASKKNENSNIPTINITGLNFKGLTNWPIIIERYVTTGKSPKIFAKIFRCSLFIFILIIYTYLKFCQDFLLNSYVFQLYFHCISNAFDPHKT